MLNEVENAEECDARPPQGAASPASVQNELECGREQRKFFKNISIDFQHVRNEFISRKLQ